MPEGSKGTYTSKQKHQAEHIEESYLEKGYQKEEAEQIAWATVNKQDNSKKLMESGRKENDPNQEGTEEEK